MDDLQVVATRMPPMSDDHMPRGGMPKEQRYGWSPLVGNTRMMRIHKDALRIDERYQRELNERRALDIAQCYDERAAGSLLVAYRDGEYYVVDGQHRLCAARKISTIRLIDCLVFDSTDYQVEAELFLRRNTKKKPPSSAEKFRAAVVCNEPTAVAVQELIDMSGRVVDGKNVGPKVIGCVAALTAQVKANKEQFSQLWPLIVELSDGEELPKKLVMALSWIHNRLRKAGDEAGLLGWRDRVLHVGYDRIVDAIGKTPSNLGWALGYAVIDELNRGCRNRISVGD